MEAKFFEGSTKTQIFQLSNKTGRFKSGDKSSVIFIITQKITKSIKPLLSSSSHSVVAPQLDFVLTRDY
ncbi:unnamed protein product [Nezara viridula]|uniref:Uncharacterized protein n=1 Tax=Nezara viridula TaxID=85310 RepID=A0A9P0MUU0_NEZVI|nr:unnamed protein product [Nezara viridula]